MHETASLYSFVINMYHRRSSNWSTETCYFNFLNSHPLLCDFFWQCFLSAPYYTNWHPTTQIGSIHFVMDLVGAQ
jgi:hypothetical protein